MSGPAVHSVAAGGADGPVFLAGDTICDRYTVIRFIAKGGMGEVYEVEDQELKTRIAACLPSGPAAASSRRSSWPEG